MSRDDALYEQLLAALELRVVSLQSGATSGSPARTQADLDHDSAAVMAVIDEMKQHWRAAPAILNASGSYQPPLCAVCLEPQPCDRVTALARLYGN